MTTSTLNLSIFQDLHRHNDVAAVPATASTSPFVAIVDGVRVAVARYRYRRTIRTLSRFQPHLLRDIGFEPEAVYDAAEGDWRGVDAIGRRG